MKKFEEMTLCCTGDPVQDAAILEWLFLAILGPLSFGYPPIFQSTGREA